MMPRFVFRLVGLVLLVSVLGCGQPPPLEKAASTQPETENPSRDSPYLLVLGVAQDAGYPQMGCEKACCQAVYDGIRSGKKVTSLGLVLPSSRQCFLFEATPDLPGQWESLRQTQGKDAPAQPDGIFLTHAHIGHYTGLMYLGREVMGSSRVPVFAMPRMAAFLRDNGPWSQLVSLDNIEIRPLRSDSSVILSEQVKVTPLLVPHRDEFSETVGFRIEGPEKSVLFIPDIDKWDKWDRKLGDELAAVDLALIDGTFFQNGELPGRDMSEIPHPFVEETMALLAHLPMVEKEKVQFIHFNHTNPLLNPEGPESRELEENGFRIAVEGQKLPL